MHFVRTHGVSKSSVSFVRMFYQSSRTAQGAERIVGLLCAKFLQILSNPNASA